MHTNAFCLPSFMLTLMSLHPLSSRHAHRKTLMHAINHDSLITPLQYHQHNVSLMHALFTSYNFIPVLLHIAQHTSQPLETSPNQALYDAATTHAPKAIMSSLHNGLKPPRMPNSSASNVIKRGGVSVYVKEAQAKSKSHAECHGDAQLKDGVDAALSKVKMKTFILIIYGVIITLDPG